MKRRIFTIGLAALLVACSGAGEENEAGAESAETAPVPLETAAPVEATGEPADDAPETQEALANRIPTRFHGTWDYVEGTCAPESDLRMEVSGSEILFYESIGVVTGIEAEGEDVVVSLAMEGEGDTWDQKTRLALVGESEAQLLETSDGEKPRVADEYPSKRCPA